MPRTSPLFEHDAGPGVRARKDRQLFAEPVDIGGAGHTIDFRWAGVAGASAVELTQASVTLYPAVAETVLPDQAVTADGAAWRVDVPSGARVRAIGLTGFKDAAGNPVVGAPPVGQRITISFPPPGGGGFDSPRFAVPAVDPQGAVPATLTGASLRDGVVTLSPAVAASRLRIALVTGANPPEFSAQRTTLQAVQLVTHTAARNARLTGPGGQPLWQVPEFDPDAEPALVDLRQALQAAFTANLKRGEPLQASVTLAADAPARCSVTGARAHGALLRLHEGIVPGVLEGDPLPLAAFSAGGPLAADAPGSAIGDLTLRYAGLRVLDEVSDPLPGPASALQGVIVGAAGAVRGWPPEALQAWQPARLGVYGRAPEACELTLELVELNGGTVGGTVGAVLGKPAVLKIEPATTLRTHWAVLPAVLPAVPPEVLRDMPALPRGVGLRVRANVGRFFWATRPDGQPIVRVAVHDPDPGGRPLLLGGVPVASVQQASVHLKAFAFPVSVFRSQAPLWLSSLFLSVDVSDLTLRYPR